MADASMKNFNLDFTSFTSGINLGFASKCMFFWGKKLEFQVIFKTISQESLLFDVFF